LWASVSALWLLIILLLLREFNALGNEYDVLINWVSAFGLILLGVFAGILISEKKIHIRSTIVFLVVFATGFFAAPFIAVGILMAFSGFSLSSGTEALIFGGSIVGYLLLYMLFWFWLRKKGVVKLGKTDQD
jgi:hypothetical protein